MLRHFMPFSSAARRARKGDHLQIRSAAAGSQRDLIAAVPGSAAPIQRARLTNFRRAISG